MYKHTKKKTLLEKKLLFMCKKRFNKLYTSTEGIV